jgi:excisionase family DNA binding protein
LAFGKENMKNQKKELEDLSHGYYSIAECARRLATTPQTIYKWMDKGQFVPVIKVGSTYRVKVQDFEDWINSILTSPSMKKEVR